MATFVELNGANLPPAALALGGAMRPHHGDRPADWIEATMRAFETPSVVDIAKHPEAGRQIARLLGL